MQREGEITGAGNSDILLRTLARTLVSTTYSSLVFLGLKVIEKWLKLLKLLKTHGLTQHMRV